MRSDAADINGRLAGSPYSYPTDDDGEARAGAILSAQVQIARRKEEVRTHFLQQAEKLREEMERDFDLRLVYESNAIEGVTTDFAATREFIRAAPEDPRVVSTYSFAEGVRADAKMLEVVGHSSAVSFVRELATPLSGRPLREVDIRDIHRLAMAAEPTIAGQYKTMDNKISGRPDYLLTARADDVSYHVAQLVDWIDSCGLDGPIPAAVAHAWMSDIHPFSDGNGRVCRLVTNYILFRTGWPCLIVRAGGDRQRYYDALQESDLGGDLGPLLSLFMDGLDRTLSEMEDPGFTRALIAEDLQRQDAYDSWHRMLNAFLLVLKNELETLGLDYQRVGFLGPSDFAWLARRDSAGNGWCSKITDRNRDLDLLLWFGYQSDDLRALETRLKPTPSIFLAPRDRSPDRLHPYKTIWRGGEVDVHEISLQPRPKSERVALRVDDHLDEVEVPVAATRVARAISGLRG